MMMALFNLLKAAVLTRTKSTFGAMRRYPTRSAVVIVLPLAHWGLKYRAKRQLTHPIYTRLEKGTRPDPLCIPRGLLKIERPIVKNELRKLVGSALEIEGQEKGEDRENKKEVNSAGEDSELDESAQFGTFGVVVGPSGTGKTSLMRDVCNDSPTGVLYVEIFNPNSCVKELAKAAGMVTSPQNLVDRALSYLVDDYRHYHILPENPIKGISYVLDQVAEQSIKFKKKHGYVPSFVLDGIDLVAKVYPEVFVALVDRAKYLSNAKLLQVTFVSGEDSVIPLINRTSSKSRASPVIEIVDISEEQATDYSRKIMPDVAEYVVSLTGGRLTQLLLACEVYVNTADKKDAKESIKKELLNACVNPGLLQIANHKNETLAINTIKTVVSKGSVHLLELKHILKKEGYDGAEVMEAIALLVSANFLRYQRDRSVTCHSKLIEWYIQENWLKEK